MQWQDINQTHHDKHAIVRYPGLPDGEQYTGRIICKSPTVQPVLASGKLLHTFICWYEVEILNE